MTITTPTILETLARRANNAHAVYEAAKKTATQHAIEVGQALIEAKKVIGHGSWLRWVKDNCKFSASSAKGYMTLARLDPANRQRVVDLSLRRALNDLAKLRRHVLRQSRDPKRGCRHTASVYHPARRAEPTQTPPHMHMQSAAKEDAPLVQMATEENDPNPTNEPAHSATEEGAPNLTDAFAPSGMGECSPNMTQALTQRYVPSLRRAMDPPPMVPNAWSVRSTAEKLVVIMRDVILDLRQRRWLIPSASVRMAAEGMIKDVDRGRFS